VNKSIHEIRSIGQAEKLSDVCQRVLARIEAANGNQLTAARIELSSILSRMVSDDDAECTHAALTAFRVQQQSGFTWPQLLDLERVR